MDTLPTKPPATLAPAAQPAHWLELAGPAALDPAQAARVERWLADLFGDEVDSADDDVAGVQLGPWRQ